MEIGQAAMNAGLRGLYNTGNFSDLKVTCGGKVFKVHKVIVCARSRFFEKACQEGRWKEGVENEIELPCTSDQEEEDEVERDDAEAVKCMFDFLYLHDYDATIATQRLDGTHESYADVSMHAKLYALGGKYGIESLKGAALEKFTNDVKLTWDSDEFPQAIKIAFTSTPDSDKGLRIAVVNIIQEHARELAGSSDLEAVVRGIDGLAYDLWKASCNIATGPACKVCGTVRIKECKRCPSAKKGGMKCCFVGCKCDNHVFCPTHRNGLLGFDAD